MTEFIWLGNANNGLKSCQIVDGSTVLGERAHLMVVTKRFSISVAASPMAATVGCSMRL